MKKSQQRILGSFAISMISICAILNLREGPIMASVGLHAIFFYSIAALCFLIPSGFVCAELASMLPENGGIFTWVSHAFGEKAGFMAIWMEWLNNVISFPASLATIVVTFAYAGLGFLHHNKIVLFLTMMLVYWGLTLFNFLSIRSSSRLSVIGAWLGMIIPGSIIIILGIKYVFSGHQLYFLKQSNASFFPDWNVTSLVFLISTLSAFSGMQVTAFHSENVKNPAKTFPRGILFAGIAIFILSLFISLSIAAVVPQNKIDLIGGIAEGFQLFLQQFHMQWLSALFIASIAFGMVASMSTWLLSLARGFHFAIKKMRLSGHLSKTNHAGMPHNVLLLQGVIGTLLASLFLFMPSLKSAFWVLVTLTSQFTVLMYILVFAAALRLRYTAPHLKRPFKIPGGIILISIITGLGISVCIIGFVLGLFPPKQIHITHDWLYGMGILSGDAIILLIPMLLLMRNLKPKFAANL